MIYNPQLFPDLSAFYLHNFLSVFSIFFFFLIAHHIQFVIYVYSWICDLSLQNDQLKKGNILFKKNKGK